MVATGTEIARKVAKGDDTSPFSPAGGPRRRQPGAYSTAGVFGAVALMLLNAVGVGLWLAINTRLISGVQAFDPYPFHLLALVASLEAVVLSMAVLVKVSGMEARAVERSCLALQAGILVEDKVVEVARMVQEIEERLRHPG